MTARQFQETDGTEGWRVLGFGANTWFATPSHASGAELVSRIVAIADELDHYPDVNLRSHGVHVRTLTRETFRLTDKDLSLVRAVSAAAAELDLRPDPAGLRDVQFTVDALDKAAVMPFWKTALGYLQFDEDLVDPDRRRPSLWFQTQDAPRPERNRIHLDVGVPHDLVAARIEAVLAAGGKRVREHSWYNTLADPEGNEVDLVPLQPEHVIDGAEDWRVAFSAQVCYPVDSVATGAVLVAECARLADAAGLPLLIDLRYGGVTIDSGKDRWETPGFDDLARAIQQSARGLGLAAEVERVRFVQAMIDAADIGVVRPFWKAVLSYEEDPREGVMDLFDSRRLGPVIGFLQADVSETARLAQRNRIHIDVFGADDEAQARIEAGIAAGGRIVYDGAPEWWTLTDPEGNEVDIAVSVGREEIWTAAQAQRAVVRQVDHDQPSPPSQVARACVIAAGFPYREPTLTG
jgi:pterin-4a-carbinolamine dehydratase